MDVSAVHHSSPHLLRLPPPTRMRRHTDLPMSRVNPSWELGVHCQQSERGNRVYIQRRDFCGGIVLVGQSRTMVEHVPDKVRIIARRNWCWCGKWNRRRGTRARGCEGTDGVRRTQSRGFDVVNYSFNENRGVRIHEVHYVLVRYSWRRGKNFSISGSTDEVASEVRTASYNL